MSTTPRPAPAARRNGPFTRANLLSTLTGGYLPLIVATLVMEIGRAHV